MNYVLIPSSEHDNTRHSASSLDAITQLAFSPKQNLVAWTDLSGTLTRWTEPVPVQMPDPVKRSIASSGSAAVSVRRGADPLDIFADDLLGGDG